MKRSARVMSFVLACAVAPVIVPQASAQTQPANPGIPPVATQAVQGSYSRAAIIPAVERIPAAGLQGDAHINYIHWYNNKYWWKRHAPIIGGAAGGGLIGGLAGGGKGALIGGAAGAGGGYLYKHHKDTHHR